jgi:CheY-like chemotaxis protein
MLNTHGTILCIDDDAMKLLLRKTLLQSVGYSVITASTGLDALTLFQQWPVAAVVVDFQMPEMNGAEVAAEMKRLRPEVPIIMLSAHADLTADHLKRTDAYLLKADDPSALFDTLTKLTLHANIPSPPGTGCSKLV